MLRRRALTNSGVCFTCGSVYYEGLESVGLSSVVLYLQHDKIGHAQENSTLWEHFTKHTLVAEQTLEPIRAVIASVCSLTGK